MLLLMLEVLAACCNCDDSIHFSYSNCSMTISNLDNSGAEPVVTQSNTISKDAFGIRVEIFRNEHICKVKPNNSFIFQSAYAMSCDCPPEFLYFPVDSIIDLKITSLKDFDSEHLADADVSEYFYVRDGNNFTALAKYLDWNLSVAYDYTNPSLEFDLLLMYPPTMGAEQQFAVAIELSDGRVFNAQTEVLQLN